MPAQFTGNGVLNIEPKTRAIKNEKLLSDVEQLAAFPDSTELHLSFRPSDKIPGKKAPWLSRMANSATDEVFRRYICRSPKERDMIIQDFFRVGFSSFGKQQQQQEWRVVKVNLSGKRQQRLFKLTCDSLLNISNNKIKTEISFAGISSVCLDSSLENAILLRFKGETEPRQIFCAQSVEFTHVVSTVLARFNQEDMWEEATENSTMQHMHSDCTDTKQEQLT